MLRAYELADSGLSGINEAAEELATMAGEELEVISSARRIVMARLRDHPDHPTRQVYWLIRRALELGDWRWQWEDTNPVP